MYTWKVNSIMKNEESAREMRADNRHNVTELGGFPNGACQSKYRATKGETKD
jgi:hypothetical protein